MVAMNPWPLALVLLTACGADPSPLPQPPQDDYARSLCDRAAALAESPRTSALDGFPGRHFRGNTFVANPLNDFGRLAITSLAIIPDRPIHRMYFHPMTSPTCILEASLRASGVMILEAGAQCFVNTGPDRVEMGLPILTGVNGTLVEGAMQWNATANRLDFCTRWRIDDQGHTVTINGGLPVARNTLCRTATSCAAPEGTATCEGGECRYTCVCPLSDGFCTDLDCAL